MSWCGAGAWAREISSPTRLSSSRCCHRRPWMWIAATSCNSTSALPMLRHIALVYQDQMRVEHYRKTDIGWELEASHMQMMFFASKRWHSQSRSTASTSA